MFGFTKKTIIKKTIIRGGRKHDEARPMTKAEEARFDKTMKGLDRAMAKLDEAMKEIDTAFKEEE